MFTRILQSGLPDEETHIVHRGDTCFAILNAFPYTSGHLLVLPYREVADLDELDAGRGRRAVGHRHAGGRACCRPPTGPRASTSASTSGGRRAAA